MKPDRRLTLVSRETCQICLLMQLVRGLASTTGCTGRRVSACSRPAGRTALVRVIVTGIAAIRSACMTNDLGFT
jgi:hypothetical protein